MLRWIAPSEFPSVALEYKDEVNGLTWNRAGDRLAVQSGGPLVSNLVAREVTIYQWPQKRVHHNIKGVDCFAFAPDGLQIAAPTTDGAILESIDKENQRILKNDLGRLDYLEFSPKGDKMYAMGLTEGNSKRYSGMWDLASGKFRRASDQPTFFLFAFQRGGKLFAHGQFDNGSVSDFETGMKICNWSVSAEPGKSYELSAVALSPDGKYLGTGFKENTAGIFEVRTGKQLFLLRGHKGAVRAVCFLPDSKLLLTGSDDETIRAWDVKSGKQVASLQGHKSGIISLAVNADGRLLASGSKSDLRVWDLSLLLTPR